MTNRHIRIQKEIYDKFDFYGDLYDEYKHDIEYNAYMETLEGIDYDGLFQEHGLPTDTSVYNDEYGLGVDLMDRYFIEENYGREALDTMNSALTDAYFDKYYDKLHELVENTISGDEENDSVR